MISACWSDSALPFDAAVRLAAERGFAHVVVAANEDRPPEDYEALASSGLVVAGTLLGDPPTGSALDGADVGLRRLAVSAMKRRIADSAHLGSQFAVLLPGANATAEGRRWFVEVCDILAEHAAGRMVRLCLGHGPRTMLPTPVHVLDFLEELRAPAGLLLDVAECPAAGPWIARVGPRLACVKLIGPMAAPSWMSEWMAALRQIDFRGHVLVERP